jgi:SAM-dependent methyltransferase
MPTVSEVRALFECPNQYYLDRRQYDIKLRAEVVKHFADRLDCKRVLDIGCGDGSVSLPLLRSDNRITLVDLSPAMTEIASGRISGELARNVELRNEDFMMGTFESECYDLIICIGLLAHVESPQDLIAKVASSLRPGGRLILEFTDSAHFVGRFTKLAHKAIRAFAGLLGFMPAGGPLSYRTNFLTCAGVTKSLAENRLTLVSAYRHAVWGLPGAHLLFSQATMYNAVRLVFGSAERSRNSWLGNEYICLVARDGDLSVSDR